MRTVLLLIVLLFLCFGCTSQQTDLTQEQKEQIAGEIKTVMDSILVKFEELDADGALQYYSPELVAVDETRLIDFQMFREKWTRANTVTSSIKWSTTEWRCMVLSSDVAVSTLVGRLEIELKSGVRITIDPQIYTDVCKKIEGRWKMVYEHPSHEATAVSTVKADKN